MNKSALAYLSPLTLPACTPRSVSGQAWWPSAAAPLVILAFAALGAAVTFLDPNDYKPQIVGPNILFELACAWRMSRETFWPDSEVCESTAGLRTQFGFPPTQPRATAPYQDWSPRDRDSLAEGDGFELSVL